MKTVIIYYSYHHGNTEKVVKRLAEKFDIDLINAKETKTADLSGYDVIGFGAGIAFGKMYKQVMSFAQAVPAGKKLFSVYTCGKLNDKYGDDIKALAAEKGCQFLGKYGCKGYDTYGPLKLVGGVNKENPTEEELVKAEEFFARIMNLQRD